MEKFLISIILFLIITNNVFLSIITFLTMLIYRIAPFNFKTLSAFILLIVYFLYGLWGLFVTSLCSIIFLICGMMYWYDLSFDSLKNDLYDFSKNVDELDNKNDKTNKNIINSSNSLPNPETDTWYNKLWAYVRKKWDQMLEYKTIIGNLIYEKLNLDDYKLNNIGTNYQSVCKYWDSFCEIIILNLKQFKTMTSDIVLYRHIYKSINKINNVFVTIENIKKLHKMSRSFDFLILYRKS